MACGWPTPPVGGVNRSSDPIGCGKVNGHDADLKNSHKKGSVQYLYESSDHQDLPQFTKINVGCSGFAVTISLIQSTST
jgi:hypothetical protein